MSDNRINEFMPSLPHMANKFVDGMRKMDAQTKRLQDGINEQVYKFYGESPEAGKLLPWTELLKLLGNYDPIIEIFTTNYDRVLENVIKSSEIPIETGRKFDGLQAKLDTADWDTFDDFLTSNGRLTQAAWFCGLATQ